MARTFIGELILRLKDEMSGKAAAAASKLDTSVEKIQAAARKLNQTSWGGQFEQRLRKLGASAADIDKLRVAWNRLESDISSRNLSKALAGFEKTNFKTAALREFGDIRKAWDDHANRIEQRSRKMGEVLKESFKPLLVAMGAYTGTYYAGMMGREGAIASAAWEREKFRGTMANIPKGEQDQLLDESEKLGGQYPSVNITEIAQMARYARSLMGDTDRGLAILPDLVKGMVTLQSAKDTKVAGDVMTNLLRGIDNAGQNKDGKLGIQSTREIIAGMIRAAQVDDDVDPGKLFQFARRGKIAVPGLSTEFLANIQPAISQDMTPEGFGTALSSAYQAFVIGSNAVASKVNIQRQKDIGIRNDKGLVDSELFGTNPYGWVKKNLIPALEKQGVDMSNETAVAEEVAKLSRNTNATGLLTRMITQQSQIDRMLEQYRNAMGPEAADQARFKDPFVAWKGFVESLRNLAAAVGEDTMPTIVAGLNGLANGINSLQQAWRDGDPMAKLGITGAAVGAGVGAWKVAGAIWALATAGTNLNTAAFALEAAAASLAAGGKGDALGDLVDKGKEKGGWLAALGGLIKNVRNAAIMGIPAIAADSMGTTPGSTMEEMRGNQNQFANDLRRLLGMDLIDANRSGSPDDRDERNSRLASPYDAATEAMRRRQAFEADTGVRGATPGLGDIFQGAVGDAKLAGGQIQDALSVSATPQVNTAQLREAVALAAQLKSLLSGIGPAVQAAHSSVSRAMNRNFTDQGVTP